MNEYVGMACTLDGKEAKITKAASGFARVSTLDGTASYEWSWDAVVRVMADDGKFSSHLGKHT